MILFIDTHTELITIALKTKDNLFIETKESEYSHSIYTMPMIEKLFKENNLNVKDLDEIIVVNGPGSFTGIRIGLSIAKTIAYALNLKIHTISSLKAYLISSDIKEEKMAVIEDNKGYYVCAFDKNNNTIVEETYLEENPYQYKEVDYKLDINKSKLYKENRGRKIMIKREILSDTDSIYNYMDGDKVLGYLEIRLVDGVIDIMNIFVNEENRKQGIATSLMEEMFKNEEYSRIMLEVNEHNDEAIRLYNKLGFKEISLRDRYYGEDTAIIMEKVR